MKGRPIQKTLNFSRKMDLKYKKGHYNIGRKIDREGCKMDFDKQKIKNKHS